MTTADYFNREIWKRLSQSTRAAMLATGLARLDDSGTPQLGDAPGVAVLKLEREARGRR